MISPERKERAAKKKNRRSYGGCQWNVQVAVVAIDTRAAQVPTGYTKGRRGQKQLFGDRGWMKKKKEEKEKKSKTETAGIAHEWRGIASFPDRLARPLTSSILTNSNVTKEPNIRLDENG